MDHERLMRLNLIHGTFQSVVFWTYILVNPSELINRLGGVMVIIITSSADIMGSVADWFKPKDIKLVHGVFSR